jgi:DNA-binding HxlR family transcriptional regulator
MRTRSYGQYCGVAHALELVGERWALLVVRDLILGPKRFTDLRNALPRIPTNVLSARLKELEEFGVVRRVVQPRPASGVAYELTEYGRELEDVILRLAAWGAKSMAEPRSEDTVNADGLILGLRAAFRPEQADGVRATYELRLGDVVVHARVADGRMEAAEGPAEDADVVIETDFAFRRVMVGEVGADEAVEQGLVRVDGDRALFRRFVEVFRLAPAPAVAA